MYKIVQLGIGLTQQEQMCATKYQIVQQSKKSPKFVNKIITKYKIVQFGANLPKAL